jgi:predicted nucleic acid-binding protein
MIHLDTSFLIRALVGGSPQDARLRAWVRQQTRMGISAICWTEFLCGPLSDEQIELAGHLISEPVAYTDAHARPAALLFNAGGRRRGSLVDCMVAATAIGAGATLATSNPKDFRRFESAGLQIAGD